MSRGQRVLGMSSVESHTDEFLPVFGTCECIARQLPGCDFCAVGSLRRSDSQTVRQAKRHQNGCWAKQVEMPGH